MEVILLGGRGGIVMSLVPSRVKCSKCGKKFFWNPDVGRGNCPRCGKRWTMQDLGVQGLKRKKEVER